MPEPSKGERDEAQRRDAVFRLRLWSWFVQKHGRSALPWAKPRGRPFRFVVLCRRCRRLVMMPRRLGPAEHERLRLHLTLHSRHPVPGTADEVLRQFDVKPGRVQ